MLFYKDYYPSGQYVCRQGCPGETFYIISNGSVQVTKIDQEMNEQLIRTLKVGDYFGEQALLGPISLRTANVISMDCECMALDRKNFLSLIGDLNELKYEFID